MRIIAQGGLTTHAPSNTMDAIMLANKCSSVDGIQIDVRMTKDDQLLVLEKDMINGTPIKDIVCSSALKVRFGDKLQKFDIPTLHKVLSCYKGTKMLLLKLYVDDVREELFAKVLANTLFTVPHIPSIYLQTENINLLNYINEIVPDYIKKGFYLYYPNDVNVLNINFFCQDHLTAQLNESKEILKGGKELMFSSVCCLEEYKTLEKELGELLYQTSIITTVPVQIAKYEKKKNDSR